MEKKYLTTALALAIFAMAAIAGYYFLPQRTGNDPIDPGEAPIAKYAGKKILYVDSYHEGYEWSDGIIEGINGVLRNTGIEFKIQRMDTERNDSEEFGEEAGLSARSVIEEFKPDVVIACDDPAFKYLIKPYYREAEIPFVFCGINWDVSIYGAPYKNTTGMLEISLVSKLISTLKEYARGERIGFIAGNTSTDKKNVEYYGKLFNINFAKTYYASTFDEWKDMFLELQDEADLAIIEDKGGITGWDDREAQEFVLANAKIPSGTFQLFMADYSLIGLIKIPEEQGEWSAQAALKILDGVSPEGIPGETNKKSDLTLNLKLAKKLNIVFTPTMLRSAKTIIFEE